MRRKLQQTNGLKLASVYAETRRVGVKIGVWFGVHV